MPNSLRRETLGADEASPTPLYLQPLFTQLSVPGLTARTAPQAACVYPLTVMTDSKLPVRPPTKRERGPSKDRRSALDIATLKESQSDTRWVDGKRHQITDPLTKRNGCADLWGASCRREGKSSSGRRRH